MQESATKLRTAKSFFTHGVSDYDHHFRASKHTRHSSLQEPGHHSPHWWKPSPTNSPSPLHHHVNGRSHLNHHGNDHKSGQSHDQSRIEAIAEGQKKLMEMAREMPESSHELSMKDLVEATAGSLDNETADEKILLSNGDMQRKIEENTRKNNNISQKKMHVDRSSSVENGGHLLKMAFPFSVASKKKTKKNVHPSSSNDGSTGRDSPKPLLGDIAWGKIKAGESEFGGSIRHSTSKSSSDSAHSHISNIRSHNEGGCWSFFCTGERHGRGNEYKNKDLSLN